MSAVAFLRLEPKNVDTCDSGMLKTLSEEANLSGVPNVKLSVKTMDSLSFADGYALSLIAQYPEDDWSDVTANLSDEVRKVADEIISPGHAKGEIKSAAQHLRQLAEKARSAQA